MKAEFLSEMKQTYQYLFEGDKITEEAVRAYYEWLYGMMEAFIKNRKDEVFISSDILNHVVIDYFVDVERLQNFQNITNLHESKVYAYSVFWILRHKPLQIAKDKVEKDIFINEDFVCHILRSYMFSDPDNVPILNNRQEDIDSFVNTLLYYFKYRDYSAKSIELLLLAFVAGRGYQYSVDHQ